MPHQILDGGGGNDCIVTFSGGPTTIVYGGPGHDRIVANLPPNTPSDAIAAICAGKGAGASATVDTPGMRARFSTDGPSVLVLVLALALAGVLIHRRRGTPRS